MSLFSLPSNPQVPVLVLSREHVGQFGGQGQNSTRYILWGNYLRRKKPKKKLPRRHASAGSHEGERKGGKRQ
jgi:hypothetical protein